MAIRTIDDSILQGIAEAIQAKDGGGKMLDTEMRGRIEAIPTGSPTVLNPALVLWDWEGTKLAEYSAEDALALTELPAPNTLPAYATADHELLLFQEWNWSLANIKTWIQNHEDKTLDVGAIYTTTDGQDHNYWDSPRLSNTNRICMQKRGVTSFSVNAFNTYRSLIQINIPNGTASIEYNAFQNCSRLKQINIPNSVTIIRDYAFKDCNSLTKINLPNGLTTIGGGAFNGCYPLAIINIPDSVTSLSFSVFASCYSLAELHLPAGYAGSFGNFFCQNCYALVKVNIPKNVQSIGNSAFYNCRSLTDILNESQASLVDVNAFTNLPSNYRIYVPRTNLSWFETATNWSTIYTQSHIVAIEDYIEYLESIGFNVDKYKEVTV